MPHPSHVEEAARGDAGTDRTGEHADAEQDGHPPEQEGVGHDERGEPLLAGSSLTRLVQRSLISQRPTDATTPPMRPWTSPSSMKGIRMNQLVAPTSFITSISRRRANIAVRIVFQISPMAAISRVTERIAV